MKENTNVQDIHSKKKKKSRIITLILVILVNLGIVTFIIVSELTKSKGEKSKLEISKLDPVFTILGIVLFGVALFAEYMKYRGMLLYNCGRLDRRGAFQVATYGKYADNITPLGAGGQPFQIHFLHKRGYPGGASTSTTMTGFLSQQIAFIIIAILVLIVSPYTASIPNSVIALRIMAYIGLGFYSFFPLLIIAFALFPKVITAMIMGFIKLGHKMRIVKDYEATQERVLKGIQEYVDLLKQTIKKPGFLLPTMFWSFVYQMAILTIPFFSIKAFGGDVDWWSTFAITINIYLAITIIPTPGNSGAAELTFNAVFSVLEAGAVFWAMLYWRALVYYSWIIIGLVVVLRTAVKNTYMHKKEIPNNRPLNVCLVCERISSIFDEAYRLAKEYAKQGHNVTLLTQKAKDSREFDKDINVISLPTYKTNLPRFNTKTRAKLKNSNFDLVHIFTPYALSRRMQRFSKRNRIPLFATFYGDYCDINVNSKEKKLKIISKKIYVNLYRRVDTVWANNEQSVATLKSYGFNRAIDVIGNETSESLIKSYISEATHPEF